MKTQSLLILSAALSLCFISACDGDDDTGSDTSLDGGSDAIPDVDADTDIGTDSDAAIDVPEPDETTTAFSFVAGLHIPSTNGGDACCFTDLDPNNDDPEPTIDNNLAALLGVLGTFLEDVDINQSIVDAIDSGSLALVLEHVGIPLDVESDERSTDATVHIHIAEAAEGDTGEMRADGEGSFTISDPTATFEDAAIGAGSFAAGPDTFPLSIPLGDLAGDVDLGMETLDLVVTDARLRGNISQCGDSVCSVDPTVTIDGEDAVVGGIELGGAVGADQIVDLINGLVGDCSCISSDLAEHDLIVGGEDADAQAYVLSCNPDVDVSSAECTDADGAICGGLGGNIGTVCSALGVVSNLIDVDIDGNGVNDGISMGIRLALVSATVTVE